MALWDINLSLFSRYVSTKPKVTPTSTEPRPSEMKLPRIAKASVALNCLVASSWYSFTV